MRKNGFSEFSIGVHRAALIGFHEWRGEKLVFQIKKSHHLEVEPTIKIISKRMNRRYKRNYLTLVFGTNPAHVFLISRFFL
jgi:hypothetical protein